MASLIKKRNTVKLEPDFLTRFFSNYRGKENKLLRNNKNLQ